MMRKCQAKTNNLFAFKCLSAFGAVNMCFRWIWDECHLNDNGIL